MKLVGKVPVVLITGMDRVKQDDRVAGVIQKGSDLGAFVHAVTTFMRVPRP